MKAKFIAATVAALMSAGSAYASPVTFSTPIVVPNTFDGIYINLLTGGTGATGAAIAGWDFNPYNSGTSLSFFWSATPSQAGGVSGTTTGPYLALSPGATVSSASTFAAVTATVNTAAFQVPGSHVLGFRFYNENTSAINYGYMTLLTGGTTGFPLTITGWTFENSGAAITVPGANGGVPEPATWAMMIMGFGAMGAAMRRTRATTLRVRYAA
jgi:hypothetical protein